MESDGIEGNAWLKDASYFDRLYTALKAEGFHESELDKIFYKWILAQRNFLYK